MTDFDFWRAGKHLRGADLASDRNAHFEVKKAFDMPTGRLQQLHGAMIEVELDVSGSIRSISGKSVYDASDPELGPVLRIVVSDPSGSFEFLLTEAKWDGRLESSKLPGCDYRVSFTGGPSC
jgi:hypothetical protein